MKTIGLIIETPIVTSLNSGIIEDVYIIAIATSFISKDETITKYGLNFKFYDSVSKTTEILAVFKDNLQVPSFNIVEISNDTEASTTTLLEALKSVLETKYSWTITSDTISE